MKKVAIIVGTRPEAIKLIPLFLYLKKNGDGLGLKPILVSTGQHKEMLDQIFQFFEVVPDVSLSVMSANQTLVDLSASLIKALGRVIDEMSPDLLIVQGDTTSAMIGSLIGFYSRIRVGHVEAGLRTYNRFSPYPEEVNRQIIGITADFHFAPTQKAYEILLSENKEIVVNVGNTVIDSLNLCLKKVLKQKGQYVKKFKSKLDKDKLVLVTGHRRENFGTGFENICNSLAILAKKYQDTRFVYPVHLNPKVKNVVTEKLSGISNISLLSPLPYDDLVFLMSQSYLILTDSGGIQEEAPTLNVPLLVMRDTTERPEGIDAGCAMLVGTDQESIIGSFEKIVSDRSLYDKMSYEPNPYGDGKTASRIAKYLSEHL
ncbi:non-hydrolyzing UDP-N-acetylglucosamine 2-epimerase [Reichenbachiella versicolor]|uniref:non-hydrolyzing UDP-N-acetylglucosamine 2-epimerase n=1 Tax=Reichenbachiella versicolor TaxID=1821036 RepID=UPI000D6E3B96|nr:UDP-N-acetylglucosamine 2-epimerase (non-hydrolyzing) [Reichenbachiella versicolor]